MTQQAVTRQARAVWLEVVERRRQLAADAAAAGLDHFEDLPPRERARWAIELEDGVEGVLNAMSGVSEVDPRQAALDLACRVTALIDGMG